MKRNPKCNSNETIIEEILSDIVSLVTGSSEKKLFKGHTDSKKNPKLVQSKKKRQKKIELQKRST